MKAKAPQIAPNTSFDDLMRKVVQVPNPKQHQKKVKVCLPLSQAFDALMAGATSQEIADRYRQSPSKGPDELHAT